MCGDFIKFVSFSEAGASTSEIPEENAKIRSSQYSGGSSELDREEGDEAHAAEETNEGTSLLINAAISVKRE